MDACESTAVRGRTSSVTGRTAVLAVVDALVLAACSRGEGPAGLTSSEQVAEAFACVDLEQVNTVPYPPDEYTCSSAGHPVLIYRADEDSADDLRQHLGENRQPHRAGQRRVVRRLRGQADLHGHRARPRRHLGVRRGVSKCTTTYSIGGALFR